MILVLGIAMLSSIVSTACSSKIGYTFVLDNSGSMFKEIARVEKGLKTLLREAPEAVSSIAIVLYNDPYVGPYLKTYQESEISNFLKKVNLKDGGDCAELSMSALKKGIELSDPGSVIFLITDADPKDYSLEKSIIHKAKAKNLTVFFVLTGCCSDCESYRFQTYNRTATALHGWSYKVKEKEGIVAFMAYLNVIAKHKASLVKLSPKSTEKMFEIARTKELTSEMKMALHPKAKEAVPVITNIVKRNGGMARHNEFWLLLIPVIISFILS